MNKKPEWIYQLQNTTGDDKRTFQIAKIGNSYVVRTKTFHIKDEEVSHTENVFSATGLALLHSLLGTVVYSETELKSEADRLKEGLKTDETTIAMQDNRGEEEENKELL